LLRLRHDCSDGVLPKPFGSGQATERQWRPPRGLASRMTLRPPLSLAFETDFIRGEVPFPTIERAR